MKRALDAQRAKGLGGCFARSPGPSSCAVGISFGWALSLQQACELGFEHMLLSVNIPSDGHGMGLSYTDACICKYVCKDIYIYIYILFYILVYTCSVVANIIDRGSCEEGARFYAWIAGGFACPSQRFASRGLW